MMDIKAKKQWERWKQLQSDDESLMKEISELNDESMIEDCFGKNLEFGTGGLRGIMGIGTNRINIYTISKATQGYANYLNEKWENPSVAIAYDSRNNSKKFANIAAEVLAGNHIKVFMYAELTPTPVLSFTVRDLNCSGGIVITASHNSSEYNGYKVYGNDGGQITTYAAKQISTQIEKVDIFTQIKKTPFDDALNKKYISYVNEDVFTKYLKAVCAQSLYDNFSAKKALSIVYTPLNGTGCKSVTQCLRNSGFTNISFVREQKEPNGDFPTCPYPNPEIREALKLGLRDTEKFKSDLLVATDPDCDRVGIAIKHEGEYIVLTANEVGPLLFEYICERRRALSKMPDHPIVIKTIVTTDIIKSIAHDYNVKVIDVLTGFKYIGEQIEILEKANETDRFIFGFEESYGYLTGSYVRDKDAVNGSLMICDMVAYYKSKKETLVDRLNKLYSKYGYFYNVQHCFTFEGIRGLSKINAIMNNFRMYYHKLAPEFEILSISDYLNSTTFFANGKKKSIDLPKADVLKLSMNYQSSLVIRPSGTEPKLKIYVSVSGKNLEQAKKLEKRLMKRLLQILGIGDV